ncbi:MAG: hypothetical protein ACE5RG_10145, partial [Candidatus Nitrosomaritimum yanchengensis]
SGDLRDRDQTEDIICGAGVAANILSVAFENYAKNAGKISSNEVKGTFKAAKALGELENLRAKTDQLRIEGFLLERDINALDVNDPDFDAKLERASELLDDIDEQISKNTDIIADGDKAIEKWKNAPSKGDLKFGAAFKVLEVGLAAAQAFTRSDEIGDPDPEHVPGFSTLKNQTIFVIDTTPPDVLVPDFEAIRVNASDAIDGKYQVSVNPPLIFDVADPSPDLFFKRDGSGPFCHEESGICGFEKLGTQDLLMGEFEEGVHSIDWFGKDYSHNQSPIRHQIVNIKSGINEPPIALDQTFTVGGFNFNPEELNVKSNNTDDEPVRYVIQSSPNKGILKSPLDPVFQNKLQETGKTSFLHGINYRDSAQLVFFPDSLNNRVMKIDTTNGDVSLGFNFTTDENSPEEVQPKGITPTAITTSDTNGCPQFLIGDWKNNKIYNVEKESCNLSSQISNVREVYDVDGLFSKTLNLDYDASNDKLFLSDATLGSIIVTSLNDLVIPNSFESPTDVLSIVNDEVWLVDSGNKRITNIDVDTREILDDLDWNGNPFTPLGVASNGTDLFVAHQG